MSLIEHLHVAHDALNSLADPHGVCEMSQDELIYAREAIWGLICKATDTNAKKEAKRILNSHGYVVFPKENVCDLGMWLSLAMDDPDTCDAMKDDIEAWFEMSKQS